MIELGKQGCSQKMMWADLGIASSTAQSYMQKYPEFAEAHDLALVHSQSFWETQLLANLDNRGFNSRLAEIALRGQFQKDYRETKEAKVEVKNEVVVDFNKVVGDLIEKLTP